MMEEELQKRWKAARNPSSVKSSPELRQWYWTEMPFGMVLVMPMLLSESQPKICWARPRVDQATFNHWAANGSLLW